MNQKEQAFVSLLTDLAYFRKDRFRFLSIPDKDGQRRLFLAVWKPGDRCARAAVSFAPYLARLDAGEDDFILARAALDAAENLTGEEKTRPCPPPEDPPDFEKIRPLLRVLAMPVKGHEDFLSQNIHLRELNLALVPYIRRTETEVAFFKNRARLEWGLSRDAFMLAAFGAMQTAAPVSAAPLGKAEETRSPADPDAEWNPGMPYWVKAGKPDDPYGAVGVFYPGVLETMAENLGGSLFVVPATVHRMLVLRAPDADDDRMADQKQDLTRFLKNANGNIPEQAVLSDRVYLYQPGYGIRPA